MKCQGSRCLALLGAACVAAPAADLLSSDFGGSLIPIGAGPRALGMGGAFVAIADDATANTWNPGGLTQLERPEVALSFGFYARETRLSQSSDDRALGVDLDHFSGALPFYAVCQQTLAIAWQRQFDFTKDFAFRDFSDTTDAFGTRTVQDDRFHVDNQGSFASLALSYAIEPLPGVSLGVTVHAWGDALTLRSHYRKRLTLDGTTQLSAGAVPISELRTTATIDEEVEISEGYSAVIGGWWQATSALTVAFNLKPSYTLHLDRRRSEHSRVFDVTNNVLLSDQATGSDTRSTLRMPTSAALGVAVRRGDLATIAADITWTRWAQMRTSTAGRTTSPINSFIAPADFPDTYALRLGYEHIVILPAFITVLRCGLLYEGLPGATEVPTAGRADQTSPKTDHYYGATIGLSVFQRVVLYDLGIQGRTGNGVGTGTEAGPDESADVRAFIVRAGVTYQF